LKNIVEKIKLKKTTKERNFLFELGI